MSLYSAAALALLEEKPEVRVGVGARGEWTVAACSGLSSTYPLRLPHGMGYTCLPSADKRTGPEGFRHLFRATELVALRTQHGSENKSRTQWTHPG